MHLGRLPPVSHFLPVLLNTVLVDCVHGSKNVIKHVE